MNIKSMRLCGVLGLSIACHSAAAITLSSSPQQCLTAPTAEGNVKGYNWFIANMSTDNLEGNFIYNGQMWEAGTGDFYDDPAPSVVPYAYQSYCYGDQSPYTGNWVSYTIGSTSYPFSLQFWGEHSSFYLNLSTTLNTTTTDAWTTSAGTTCPGTGTGLVPTLAAANTSGVQIFCNSEFVLTIATAETTGPDPNTAVLVVNDNPAAVANGTQIFSASSSTATAVGQDVYEAEAGSTGYGLASHIVAGRRWSLFRRPTSKDLSGVRYSTNGTDPEVFVFCKFVRQQGDQHPERRKARYRCQKTPVCIGAECRKAEWRPTNRALTTFPVALFDRPISNTGVSPTRTPPKGGDDDIKWGLKSLSAKTPRAVQKTPQGRIKLISAALQKSSWSLAYLDGYLLGAVPKGALGTPRFIACTPQASANRHKLAFTCYEAYKCRFGPCTPDQWRRVATINLPKSFLRETP